MAEQESIPALIRSVLDDARELVREELALAKAELREEWSAAQAAGIAFAVAALLAVIAIVMLCVALGGALAALFGLPTWAGYGIVAILLAGGAFLFVSRGRSQMAKVQTLPKTRETLQENMEWIRSKSNAR